MEYSDRDIICRACSELIERSNGHWERIDGWACSSGSKCEPSSCEDFDFEELRARIDEAADKLLARLGVLVH